MTFGQFLIMRKQLLLPLLILLFLIVGTTTVALYAKGYRFLLQGGKPHIAGTGLLVATSIPNGAEVLINGRLATATDNTINLAPGEYLVKIQKDGYFPWEKKIIVKTEVVSKAEALLFPNAPKLESITSLGVEDPILDPSLTKIAYKVSTQSAKRNGIYVIDMTNRPILTLQNQATQIVDDVQDIFSKASISFSPDASDVIATSSSILGNRITYQLKTNGYNPSPEDITDSLELLGMQWQEQIEQKEKARLDSLKKILKEQIVQSFKVITYSPDETKILYIASQSATLPIIIKPPIIGANSTPEDRKLNKDSIYIYDIKEDKNYKLEIGLLDYWIIGDYQKSQLLVWFPDSKHLIYVHDKRIEIMEYDGLNRTVVYAGPFADSYVFPHPNASKIVILTNLNNPSIAPNLYTISLK
ncbi:MAG: hypothetical protein A3F31_00060 [Candidatus Levybacteria bacterium RIFCSPHIGHO2_12_FULL_38_12]|nr:MAG: hypothetical protein A3F31_00060 [Candidatus Levybacteria bacterium RIFCSPHIGHO2_12_FULL_38_12]OGH34594.1 MAG: hypothetical protein A3A47_01530 [Candidatus Levybacteria bacterium RIFCSPLOWO2_01_FULL_37_20]OGH43432.1 MAG: hypothetical protein A3J14_04515 [Candidatus Levybacteria bacterium RIFCSPLOWO2_02_FULL_37_18]OGH51183.1 MAG: hypothetical protein A3G13_00045 [Candidatus Levybacteria bacterium RIFCSPLOWO2_12_FULL_37_7]